MVEQTQGFPTNLENSAEIEDRFNELSFEAQRLIFLLAKLTQNSDDPVLSPLRLFYFETFLTSRIADPRQENLGPARFNRLDYKWAIRELKKSHFWLEGQTKGYIIPKNVQDFFQSWEILPQIEEPFKKAS